MPTLFQSPSAPTPAKMQGKVLVPEVPKATSRVRSHLGPLTAFAMNPTDVHFETQEAQEPVVLLLRQHLIVNLPWAALSILFLLTPSVLLPFIFGFLRLPFAVPAGYVIIGTLFWYVATFGFMLGNFLSWFFNLYIVTNSRIIDIDFVHLLYKQFSEANVSKIQDISYKTEGLLPTIFNYGDVSIETAGELPNFNFERVPYPEKIVQVTGELAEKARGSL